MKIRSACWGAIAFGLAAIAVSCSRPPSSPFGLDGDKQPSRWHGGINTSEEADALYLFAGFSRHGGTNTVDIHREYDPGYPIDRRQAIKQEALVEISDQDMAQIYSLFVRGIAGAAPSLDNYKGTRSVGLQLIVGDLNISVSRHKPHDESSTVAVNAREIMAVVDGYNPEYTAKKDP